MSDNNHIYMYGYCSTCAFIHNFTPTNVGIFVDQNMHISTLFLFCTILHLLMQVLCTQFTTILALSFFYMGSLHYTYIEPRGNPWPCVFTVLVAITLKWKINPDWPKNLYELDTIQFVRHYYIVQFMTIYNMSIRYVTF